MKLNEKQKEMIEWFCKDKLCDVTVDLDAMDWWYEKLRKTIECEIELGI